MNLPLRRPKLKLFLCLLAPLTFIFVGTSCMMMSRQQVAENALFRLGDAITYEFKTGDQISERVLTDEEVSQVKQILRVDQRSRSRSFVSHAPQLRIKSGRSDINICSKTIVINLADPEGTSSQYVSECDEDTHNRMINLLVK